MYIFRHYVITYLLDYNIEYTELLHALGNKKIHLLGFIVTLTLLRYLLCVVVQTHNTSKVCLYIQLAQHLACSKTSGIVSYCYREVIPLCFKITKPKILPFCLMQSLSSSESMRGSAYPFFLSSSDYKKSF